MKRVCIFGPESTGKSTLAKHLAEHFGTVCVPEFAFEYLHEREGSLQKEDMVHIARGQLQLEQDYAEKAHRVLFSDTDLITTTIWSKWLFGDCDKWIEQEADKLKFDLYLVLDVDVPWIADKHRYLPDERKSFFNVCVQELDQRNRPYKIVGGNWEQRFETAVGAVNALLQDG